MTYWTPGVREETWQGWHVGGRAETSWQRKEEGLECEASEVPGELKGDLGWTQTLGARAHGALGATAERGRGEAPGSLGRTPTLRVVGRNRSQRRSLGTAGQTQEELGLGAWTPGPTQRGPGGHGQLCQGLLTVR